MVERQIVDLVVVGSNPITHPFYVHVYMSYRVIRGVLSMAENALVAQLDRATDFESVGRTFEPCRAHVFSTSFYYRTYILSVSFYLYIPLCMA